MNITINFSEEARQTSERMRSRYALIGPPNILKITGYQVGSGSQMQTEKVLFTVVFNPAVTIQGGAQSGSPTLQGLLMNSQRDSSQDISTLVVQNNPADGTYRTLTLAFDNIPAGWHGQSGAFEIYLVDSNNNVLATDGQSVQF